jgi:hypothetical protein
MKPNAVPLPNPTARAVPQPKSRSLSVAMVERPRLSKSPLLARPLSPSQSDDYPPFETHVCHVVGGDGGAQLPTETHSTRSPAIAFQICRPFQYRNPMVKCRRAMVERAMHSKAKTEPRPPSPSQSDDRDNFETPVDDSRRRRWWGAMLD